MKRLPVRFLRHDTGKFYVRLLRIFGGNIAAICTVSQPEIPQAEAAKWLINIISLRATVTVTFSLYLIARKALDETI